MKEIAKTVVDPYGRVDKVIYEEVISYKSASSENAPLGMDAQDVVRKVEYREMKRMRLCPTPEQYGCQIPKGAWHTVEAMEPSVILESEDGNVNCNE